MSKGCFVDKARPPTSEEIRAAVTSAFPLWDHLIQFISQTYGGAGNLKFYGKSYGWAPRFQKSGKNLLSLYPGDGCFTAQIIIGPAHVDAALGLGLGEHAREAIAAAHPYPEGRWLYIPVTSRQEVEDIQQLLSIKAKPATSATRKRRSLG